MSDHIQELLPFYALDALSEEEKQLVEKYLKEHPEAQEEVELYADAASLIPFENEPMVPSPEVKRHLMNRISQAEVASAARLPEVAAPTLMARVRQFLQVPTVSFVGPAFAVMAALLVFFFIRMNSFARQIDDLNVTISEQVALIALQREQLTQQEETLAEVETSLAVYTSPSSHSIFVASTGVQPDAVGKLTLDPATSQAILDVSSLHNDPETVYQLWFIQGDTPVSAGVFDVDEFGNEQFLVTTAVPASFDAIGISIEPPGGSETPTGDIILFGTASS